MWGDPRRFQHGSVSVKVVPDLDRDNYIRDLIPMWASGDNWQIVQVIDNLRQVYIGKPYQEWAE